MPRLVRRRPLIERVKAYLNPLDFLLWLSEEIETRDWDPKRIANPAGLALNFAFLICRANSGPAVNSGDDVFGDAQSRAGWLAWFASLIAHLLICFSIGNAAYTFFRKRHYRLFENSIDITPSTPSAHRVRVDSSPVSSSPLHFLTHIIGDTGPESRSHPDATRDVWEIAVWDPLPVCLRLFCLFSPGHILVYLLFLPVSPSDPRPSTTVATTLLLTALLSAQLLQLQSNFSQQSKDTAVIHKEVLNEYDIKFVHARLNHPVRDVGTQFSGSITGIEANESGVDTYTPTTILRRGFSTNPNPNYTKHIDPEGADLIPQRTVLTPNSIFQTPQSYPRRETTPLRNTYLAGIRQPQFRQSASSINTNTGGGGSLGIFSHANSPLKKAPSMNNIQLSQETPRNSIQMARKEQIDESRRSLSPVKRLKASDIEEKENLRERSSLPPGYREQKF